jgi:zinc/manganese transport system substrate-binding protein
MFDRRSLFSASAAAFLFLATAQTAHAQTQIETIASNTIIADLVAQVGGERIKVETLAGAGVDAHVFQPAPADARRVAAARLVFVNGLGLEGWLPRLVQATGGKAQVVTLSKGVKPIREKGNAQGHSHGHEHGHGDGLDPHAWQDVANTKIYVANIRDALIGADPQGRDIYQTRANAYLAELDKLDADIRKTIGAIPEASRRIITTHDAFGYFTRAYALRFIAPQGVSTEAEISSRDVARIIRQIKAEKIAAIFIESAADERIMTQIAKETGARIGGRLYADALTGKDGPAPTYVAMMQHNLRAFAEALQR